MKKFLLLLFMCLTTLLNAQKPCSDPIYHQFDFWIGNWEVFGLNNQKAGVSKISQILGGCVILEEWESANKIQGLQYAGKSFNSYNNNTGQWQQTWVDNTGSSTEYLKGKFKNNTMVFETYPFKFSKDSLAIRRLTFFSLSDKKVRQLGEISKDDAKTWVTEYDLEYRKNE